MNASNKKTKTNPHAGHRDRVRKRFLEEGADGFEKHELLELLLFGAIPMQDTNPIAHRLLDMFDGSFTILFNSDPREIVEKCNVSMNTAVFLKALGAISKRCQKEKLEGRVLMNSPETSGEYAVDLLLYENVENFYIFCLDSGNHLIPPVTISKGSQTKAQVEVGDVVREAVLCQASSVILVHNHPGGGLRPSASDIQLTSKLLEALEIVHIFVADHIITANHQYFSFVQNGFLKNGVLEKK